MILPLQDESQHVLVLGGTGTIGSAVAGVLAERGHRVTCLARSGRSAQRLAESKFRILRGDIRAPEQWADSAAGFDSVIQAANTWSDDMGEVDSHLIEVLLEVLSSKNCTRSLIHTGGCWLYGHTQGVAASEQSPYSPIASFSREMETGIRVCRHAGVRGMVIHPAMVYERDGGVLEAMLCDVKRLGRIRVIGRSGISWTMVHRMDIAQLYALVLEKGKRGENYNGSGVEGIEVGMLANALTQRFQLSAEPEILPLDEAVSRFGEWAIGYSLDQKMSSKKAMQELGWVPRHTDVIADIA